MCRTSMCKTDTENDHISGRTSRSRGRGGTALTLERFVVRMNFVHLVNHYLGIIYADHFTITVLCQILTQRCN